MSATTSPKALTLPAEDLSRFNATLGSKLWRLTHLYKIVNKVTKQLTPLVLNPIQQAIYNEVHHKARLREYVLKYRQGGVSTFWLIWWLDDTIFNMNTTCGILSHEKESLVHLWSIVRLAYDQMPLEYKPKSGKYNEHELTFPDINSRIFVSLSIRSTRVDNLHVSEICHMDAKDIRASMAAVPPNGNITVESTANGVGNEGHLLYEEGKLGQNQFHAMFFPWWIQPEYRIALNGMKLVRSPEEKKLPIDDEQVLFRRETKRVQRELFDQEFAESDETAFLTTGNAYFDNKKVMALLREARELEKDTPPIEETYEYVMWEAPHKYDVYVAGADTAEGIDGDYSVLKILNVTKRKEVFRWRARVAVDAFAKICDHWCRKYMKALLAVERNNHGHAVILSLYEILKYPNLYTQDQEIRITKTRGINEPKKIVKIGWDTTSITKPLMMDQLKTGIEGDSMEDADTFQPEFTVYDQVFLQEALTTIQEGDTICAAPGKHDDTVIATAIAFQMYLKMRSKVGRAQDAGIMIGDRLQAIGII